MLKAIAWIIIDQMDLTNHKSTKKAKVTYSPGEETFNPTCVMSQEAEIEEMIAQYNGNSRAGSKIQPQAKNSAKKS